jgi:hypothetical protein
VPHAEALLLVDDDQPEIAEGDFRRKDRVGADYDVARARGDAAESAEVGLRGLEARNRFDSYRGAVEAAGEGF